MIVIILFEVLPKGSSKNTEVLLEPLLELLFKVLLEVLLELLNEMLIEVHLTLPGSTSDINIKGPPLIWVRTDMCQCFLFLMKSMDSMTI